MREGCWYLDSRLKIPQSAGAADAIRYVRGRFQGWGYTNLENLKGKSLHRFEGGFERRPSPIYDQPRNVGASCANKNCIVHDQMESQYVRNKFYVLKTSAPNACRLRCFYCESDIEQFVVASKKNKWFSNDHTALLRADDQHPREHIVFPNKEAAIEAGFHSRRGMVAPGTPPRTRRRAKS